MLDLMKISKSCSRVIQKTLRSGKNWLRYSSFSAISRVKWKRDQTFEQISLVIYIHFGPIFRTVCFWDLIDLILSSYSRSPKKFIKKCKFCFLIQNISSPFFPQKQRFARQISLICIHFWSWLLQTRIDNHLTESRLSVVMVPSSARQRQGCLITAHHLWPFLM